MSLMTLESEAIVVMTELADEEISGIVGGGKNKVDIDVDVDNDVNIKNIKGKNIYIDIVQQTATAIALKGKAIAKNYNDVVYF